MRVGMFIDDRRGITRDKKNKKTKEGLVLRFIPSLTFSEGFVSLFRIGRKKMKQTNEG